MKFLTLSCFVLALCNTGSGIKVQIREKQLYKVTPRYDYQLKGLRRLGSNSEVILWSGMGETGEPVEYLAVPEAMEKFKEKLVPLNLTVEVQFAHVEITMSTTPLPKAPSTVVPSIQVLQNPQRQAEQSAIHTALKQFHRASSGGNSNKFKKIPGTNLHTGIWYIMKMKRFPQGFVTWTDETNDHGAHFVQIDLNPGNLPHYKIGEKWYNDVQWRFGATDDPNYYTWDNRVLSTNRNAITTWSYKEVGSGFHIIASTKPKDVTRLGAIGEWRVHALWKPVQAEGVYYKLINKNFPQGTITWTDKKYGDHSHYIQVDTYADHRQHYAQGGKWFNDALFSFEPAGIEITASISQFKFMDTPQSVLNAHKKSDGQSNIMKLTLLNPSSATYSEDIEESFSKTNTYSYGFEQSMKVFMKVTSSFSIPLIASGSVEAGFEATVGSNQQFTKSTTKTYSVKKTVQVLPKASVEVSAFSEWIQDLEIPFNATMLIRGTIATTTPLSGAYLQDHLTSLGEKYTVLETGDDYLMVNIKGKFKGTFGYRGIVSVENIKKPRGGIVDNDNDDSSENCVCPNDPPPR